jgi:PAS domain S-box-containing protein
MLKPTHIDLNDLSKEELMVRVTSLQEENRLMREYFQARELELARHQANLSSLIENTHDMILSADRNHKLLVANSPTRKVLRRFTEKDVPAGTDLRSILPEEVQKRWLPLADRALQGESFKEVVEVPVEEKTVYLECAFNPIYDGTAEIAGFSFFGKDVSSSYKQQEKIRKNEQLLASINYSIQEGIFRTTTRDGIVYINQCFMKMFGYDSEDEMYPIDPGELYVDPSRRDFFRHYMQDHTYFNNEEAEFKRKDGSTFWGLVSSIKQTDEKGNTYYDGAIRDITEKREAARALEAQNKELVKVNRELDKLVYSTSHDLRAPLVSIMGLISIARIEADPQERNRYFDLMIKSLNKLDDFIKDIMGYSRNSRAEIRHEEINFPQIIDEAFNSLRYADRYANIERRIEVSGDGVCHSDPVRMQIILNNLISNACRYSDPEEENPYVAVKVILGESGTQIEVSDNGIGIEPRYMDKIFDMFYRATNNSDGSGIGLYIVREAVNKLKGIINVHSVLGEGTSFHMEIPALVKQEEPVAV